MEKQKKEKTIKSNDKAEIKNEIIVKKRINLLDRVSLRKSPSFQQSCILKSKKYDKNSDKNNKDTITRRRIKLPSDLISKKQTNDIIFKNKNLTNRRLNNCQSEIEEKNIIFKKNNEDKKKILGQIITDFSTNKKLNNNIFDVGNQLTLNINDNNNFSNNLNNFYNNNTINTEINDKTLETNIINELKNNKNNIQEIRIKNFNVINNNKKSMKIAASSSKPNYFKRRPFYITGINNIDKNNRNNNNNDLGTETIQTKIGIGPQANFSNTMNSLNAENILENVRKRNKTKKIDYQVNSITYNDT